MDKLLEFEKETLLNVLNENSLTVISKGIGIDRLMLNLVKTYSSSCHLVLVIGADFEEENYLISQLSEHRSTSDDTDDEDFVEPRRISAESMTANNRRDLYLSGGVIFITTRLLVVDMLTKRVPFECISGIIVANAHRVLKDCHLSFILRLYRLNNKTGFITALSQNAQSFLGQFAKLERIMRQLFVSKLYLWPRFHATIGNSFASRKSPNVVEIRIYMTVAMKQIQFALIDLISMCLKELTSMNSFIYSNSGDAESNADDENALNTINVISKNFNKIIHANMDSVWFQLSARARRMIRDVQLLKSLLFHLTELDAVSFFGELKHIKDSVTPDSNPSDWLFWTPTETLFKLAQERVFLSSTPTKGHNSSARKYCIEINPKLEALNKLLNEIESSSFGQSANNKKKNKFIADNEDEKEDNVSSDNETDTDEEIVDIIIVVENRYSIKQIETLRDKGIDVILDEMKQKCELYCDSRKVDLLRKLKAAKKMGKDPEEVLAAAGESEILKDLHEQMTLTQMLGEFGEHETSIIRKHNHLQLHYYEWSEDRSSGLGLKQLLTSLRPDHVILFEPEMGCIRQIELYQALISNDQPTPINVHFFIFDGSAEEQRYLRNLQIEKESFEKLIEEKSRLAKSKDCESLTDNHPDLIRGEKSLFHPDELSSGGSNSRIGGGAGNISALKENETRQVLVDMREFRSMLPSFVHKLNIELEPVTLEIGDYLLTPDTCLERKSIADLIGSLNTGRLYNQAQIMTRYYKRPLLLIEFEEAKSFNFKARYWSSVQNTSGLNTKPSPLLQLVVLTIQFPLLRIIWSPTPNFSADIIDRLKHGKEEPDRNRDIISTTDSEQSELPVEFVTDRYDIEAKEFLLCLPGVTTQNVYSILNRVKSIADLVGYSLEQLGHLLDSTHHATLLYRALHGNLVDENERIKSEAAINSKKRFTFVRRKKPSVTTTTTTVTSAPTTTITIAK